ncbi:MAG: hypothetical protein JW751_14090 [Polyangiaceae bacterium]|nr:hypothetical protein [Polyangiaceae bacterium]
MRPLRSQPVLVLGLVSLVGLGWVMAGPAACCRREVPGVAAVDPALLAFLSRARSAHHRADLLENDGSIQGALAELSAIIDGPMPGGPRGLPEVREVLADTLARRADLASRLGRHDSAVNDVQRGLGLAPETTYFRGHLFEVLGLVEERRSWALDAEIERVLASVDERMVGQERARLERLVADRDTARRALVEGSPEAADALRAAKEAADRALRDARLTRLAPEERARLEAQSAAIRSIRERALTAFAEAIAIQSQVIEQSLADSPLPPPSGSGP